MQHAFLNRAPPSFVALSLNVVFTNQADWLIRKLQGGHLCLPGQQQDCRCKLPCSALYVPAGRSNSGPHTCSASIWLTEQSPRPLFLFYKHINIHEESKIRKVISLQKKKKSYITCHFCPVERQEISAGLKMDKLQRR